jgi:FkbM family methyltransferase
MKEPETVAWIEEESPQGGVLYDIGANVGAYALIAAKRGLTVVAFEPAPQNFAVLHENISLNGLDTKITAVPQVLGARSGVHTFSFADYTRGATEGFFTGQKERAVQKPLLVETLDAIVRSYHLALPSLIKIDVDGGELEVLAGAKETLAAPSLRSILIEVEEGNREAVHTILTAAGFTRSSLHSRRRSEMANLIYSRLGSI